jgi:uncharacterized protein YbjQ (UPF0145 family)
MLDKCPNCGKSLGGIFGGLLIDPKIVSEFQSFIRCPDQICTNCDGSFRREYETAKSIKQGQNALLIAKSRVDQSGISLPEEVRRIPVVSIAVLPIVAEYKLVEMVSFQSTLGTGFFSEFGSDISNILGTEANMFNEKMEKSMNKCLDVMRILAHSKGANAVIGAAFQFTSNTRDAMTVAGQGTAVVIKNIEEVFVRVGPLQRRTSLP